MSKSGNKRKRDEEDEKRQGQKLKRLVVEKCGRCFSEGNPGSGEEENEELSKWWDGVVVELKKELKVEEEGENVTILNERISKMEEEVKNKKQKLDEFVASFERIMDEINSCINEDESQKEVQKEVENLKKTFEERDQNEEANWALFADTLLSTHQNVVDLDKTRKSKMTKWETSLKLMRNSKPNLPLEQNSNNSHTTNNNNNNNNTKNNSEQKIWDLVASRIREDNNKNKS